MQRKLPELTIKWMLRNSASYLGISLEKELLSLSYSEASRKLKAVERASVVYDLADNLLPFEIFAELLDHDIKNIDISRKADSVKIVYQDGEAFKVKLSKILGEEE